MEFYMPLFDAIEPHVREHAVLYLIGVPLVLAGLYFSRSYSVPLVLYALELAAYTFLMHSIIHVVVRLAAWFKNNSTMEVTSDGRPVAQAAWTTPWLQFWERDIYDPESLIWVELVFVGIVVALMYKFRPMKTQYKHTPRYAEPAQKRPEINYDDDDWGVPRNNPYSKNVTPSDQSTRYKR